MTFFPSDNRFTTLNIRDNAKIFAADKKQQRLVHLKEYHIKMYMKGVQLNEDAGVGTRRAPASNLVKLANAHDKIADMINGGVYASRKAKDIKNLRKGIEDLFDSYHTWKVYDEIANDMNANPVEHLTRHGLHHDLELTPALKKAILQTHDLRLKHSFDQNKQKFLQMFDQTDHEKRDNLLRDLLQGTSEHIGHGYSPNLFFSKRMAFRPDPWYTGNASPPGKYVPVNSGYLLPEIQEHHENAGFDEPLDIDVLKTIGEHLKTHKTSGGNVIPGYVPTTRDIAAVHSLERGISPTDWIKDVYKANSDNRNIIGSQFDRQGSFLPSSWPAHVSEYAANNPKSEIGGYYRRYHQLPHDWTPEGWHEGMQDTPPESRTETPVIPTPREVPQETSQETQSFPQIQEPETTQAPRRNIMDVVKAILRKKII